MQEYVSPFRARPFKILQRPSRITVREPCQYKFSLVDRRRIENSTSIPRQAREAFVIYAR